ncbi:MAG: N-acetylmuramoyl-L-alanine amidase [Kofleriaceae bacterium]
MKHPTMLALAGCLALSHAASGAPTVVIDPGHGGSNSGAQSRGFQEKHLTLSIANQVAARLRDRAINVELTRTTDRTMTLRQRVAVADQRVADLFVSIHANASELRTQQGFETYVLTPRAVDIDGRALRSDTTTTRPGIDPEIALVLDDVERGSSQWEAAELASKIQRALRERRGERLNRGVKQDSHHVLLGATMPAVLVEIGFIDHPIEGKQLADPAVQSAIADALAEAIADQLSDAR